MVEPPDFCWILMSGAVVDVNEEKVTNHAMNTPPNFKAAGELPTQLTVDSRSLLA
jgi:hypothetical protein